MHGDLLVSRYAIIVFLTFQFCYFVWYFLWFYLFILLICCYLIFLANFLANLVVLFFLFSFFLSFLFLSFLKTVEMLWLGSCCDLFGGSNKLLADAGGAEDTDSFPGVRRSHQRVDGNLLQYSCRDNSTDRGAWWTTAHSVKKSQTRLSTHAHKWYLTLFFSWLHSFFCFSYIHHTF